MAHTQQLILHHVSGASGDPPTPTTPTPYARWNSSSRLNYGEIERHLFPSAATADDEEDDTKELEDEDGDDDDYEWSLGALASFFFLFGLSIPKGEN